MFLLWNLFSVSDIVAIKVYNVCSEKILCLDVIKQKSNGKQFAVRLLLI